MSDAQKAQLVDLRKRVHRAYVDRTGLSVHDLDGLSMDIENLIDILIGADANENG